jgi:hypothetical protein
MSALGEVRALGLGLCFSLALAGCGLDNDNADGATEVAVGQLRSALQADLEVEHPVYFP